VELVLDEKIFELHEGLKYMMLQEMKNRDGEWKTRKEKYGLRGHPHITCMDGSTNEEVFVNLNGSRFRPPIYWDDYPTPKCGLMRG
jgi:hypothetical protein